MARSTAERHRRVESRKAELQRRNATRTTNSAVGTVCSDPSLPLSGPKTQTVSSAIEADSHLAPTPPPAPSNLDTHKRQENATIRATPAVTVRNELECRLAQVL
ncbi:hypothetical protein MKEN_01024100 [Mycena kentingensis (nom. inval.)]|nr:hypothetical protein MKEN_01024100 [Mycena kentingensis (nom. inval.)]